MPRERAKQTNPAKTDQQRILWEMTGDFEGNEIWQWDPKESDLIEALLWVVSSGATVVMRPGSGGRAMGIAIWEGDVRHPPKWCYEADELDAWSQRVLAMKQNQKAGR